MLTKFVYQFTKIFFQFDLFVGRLIHGHIQYRWTSLYARDRNSKNMLECNEFAYKKTNNHCRLEDRFQKKGHFSIAFS